MRRFQATTLEKLRTPKAQEFYINFCEQCFIIVTIVEVTPKCLDVLTGLQPTSLSDTMTETNLSV